MPRLFPEHFTTVQLQQVLTELQQGPYAATPANAIHFPSSRGIYFWYMQPEGYEILSQHIVFPAPFGGQTTDEHGNHLVYLGTAGTRPTANNQAGLQDRFVWHVSNHHAIPQVRHGTLSTLRQTLGSLLANDLIEVDGVFTEVLVNQFMADYFTVSYIAYEGILPAIGLVIDADEVKLIQALTPLLNLKKNPDIAVLGHPTRQIKARRIAINQATQHRINQL